MNTDPNYSWNRCLKYTMFREKSAECGSSTNVAIDIRDRLGMHWHDTPP
jgi:hypothetical protein